MKKGLRGGKCSVYTDQQLGVMKKKTISCSGVWICKESKPKSATCLTTDDNERQERRTVAVAQAFQGRRRKTSHIVFLIKYNQTKGKNGRNQDPSRSGILK